MCIFLVVHTREQPQDWSGTKGFTYILLKSSSSLEQTDHVILLVGAIILYFAHKYVLWESYVGLFQMGANKCVYVVDCQGLE